MTLWYSLFGTPKSKEDFFDSIQRAGHKEVAITFDQRVALGRGCGSYEVVCNARPPKGPDYVFDRRVFSRDSMTFTQQRLLEAILLKVCAFPGAITFGRFLEGRGITVTVDGLSLDAAKKVSEQIDSAPQRGDTYLCDTIVELRDHVGWPSKG